MAHFLWFINDTWLQEYLCPRYFPSHLIRVVRSYNIMHFIIHTFCSVLILLHFAYLLKIAMNCFLAKSVTFLKPLHIFFQLIPTTLYRFCLKITEIKQHRHWNCLNTFKHYAIWRLFGSLMHWSVISYAYSFNVFIQVCCGKYALLFGYEFF